MVGEGVYTIGNPLGELTYSLTDGLVSALDRLITTTSTNPSTGAAETTTLNVLQTNCDINPGNSGGLCLTTTGRSLALSPPSIPVLPAPLPPLPWKVWASPSPWTTWRTWSPSW